ncbi:bifunctional helix-turn-helix transcriptional regulator/GNAT family N-acetyltransferase [Streptantibioticus ferralitis]|uniref:Bifunctional helix-turn-helix transcriptional regulator/GNAT family N-acetyltransferase n=1 Tax=Streptantibioticus ferralitis TaxID=236510 RepID=A0ABT5YUZ7_9ACTN|nr:bifunctional helix-turn-helix transcriptional regulator/GNAT family N-acetyltransferase [Streptantibioticus ferralitis]MDF2255431.1 bifunctional helix-turn-helix transcriptional regulator/GNAT family N-acetyltransferase [Streptantibioticus ferralitis]
MNDTASLAPTIDAVRTFNRFYTSLIGALDYEGRLGTPYSLTEARVLYELHQTADLPVPRLRHTVRADAAHLSRVLTRLEKAGLITREPLAADRRVQVARLTDSGRAAAALLDERSQHAVTDLVGRLGAGQRHRLGEALHTVTAILTRPRLGVIALRRPAPGDLGWVIQRNAAIYAEQFGWNEEYEALVARIVADFAAEHDPAQEAALIAQFEGEPVGCVFCVRDTAPGTARLRLLLVEPSARGHGIGERLVRECVDFARSAGYRELVLWTNDVLVAARRIYQRAGFELVAEKPHHSFGQDLVGQDWRLVL